ncbi:cathepsin L1-like [Protobothrops mucrosquamatus]|uniref:cathepsin L1-like n=1 Tax=Protobothrops mucrosquamatus TaxID=103944 RepID=UPI0010FB6BD9|nr:cathepsin L1-like [Protobothrops mucrosquamatus]
MLSTWVLAWLVSLRTLSTALDPTLEGTWRDWKATHSKEYGLGEESFRRAVWEENLRMIHDHNSQAEQGKYTYKLGMNHFGDLDDYSCRYEAENSVTKCSTIGVILPGDEKGFLQAVATIGPISVGVDARSSAFQFYKSGIFKNPWRGDPQLTHAMLVVGYNSTKYWIVKNSWSRYWGDNGYMLLEQGFNQCGITNMASYPIP